MELCKLAMALVNSLQKYPEALMALLCFFYFFRRINRHRRVPVKWPVVGMIPAVIANRDRVHDWLTDLLRCTGYTYLFKGPWGAPIDVLVTCDPANVGHVFTSNFGNYPKGREFAEMFDVLGNGIFNADDHTWSFQRRKAHFFMSDPKFRSYVAESTACKLKHGLIPLLGRLGESRHVVDLQDVFLRLSFDTTAKFVFGFDPGCLSEDFPMVPFAKAMDEVEEVLFYRHVTPIPWLKLQRRLGVGQHKKMTGAWRVIDQSIVEYISRKRDEMDRKDGDEEFGDLMSYYLASEEEIVKSEGLELDRFLRDTALNFMVAGRDTTSSALTWFFYMLHKNPSVEKKILEELKLHAPQNPSYPTATELKNMVYLHAALSESLRLFPPVPFEHKAAMKPDMLPCGISVNTKRRVIVSLYAMGRMEGIWGKDSTEFRPERWLSATGKFRHEPSYKFMAFNSGPRTCLGKDLAYTQMKAVVAAVLTQFKIEVEEGFVAKPKLSVILHMKDGLRVRIKRREMHE